MKEIIFFFMNEKKIATGIFNFFFWRKLDPNA